MARIASGMSERVSERQAVTWIDLAEAPESKGHTVKIPVRAGVLLWAGLESYCGHGWKEREGRNGAIFGCQQCWTQGLREHSCLLSQALEPWNPLTSPMYMAMRPSQEGDSLERWPSKGSRVAQSTRTGSVVSCLQLTPATPHRDTSRGLN